MKFCFNTLLLLVALFFGIEGGAAAPSANGVERPKDARLEPLKDLNGYFPFQVPESAEAWNERADRVRRQILVSQGLWPMPTKLPLNAVIHGRIELPDYTVEKVYFESAPGLFVTGNLYRPTRAEGKVPGVLFAHGHWKDARLALDEDENVRREIATGAERFELGGKSRFQSMCVQLARMGCVVWQWDMLGDSDSVQFSREVIHEFAKQRPEMNTRENWGLYSPQAEAHLQSVMGLQTWNSIRSLDFLASLPEVDPNRIAITGASGGGTQTMILAAIDPRIALSFPAVMVSTAMQGGCTCENASLLRVNTGNIEFAALFAPKPQGLTTADDWTKELSTKGFPELRQLYRMLGVPEQIMIHRGEHFPHNYNAVARSAFYGLLNRHFELGFPDPVIERDYQPLSRDALTVWNDEHPAPKANDADFERQLLNWFAEDAAARISEAAESAESFRKEVAPAVEILIGRTFASAGGSEWLLSDKHDRDSYIEMTGFLRNTTYNETIPVVWLYPKNWDGRVVVWLDDSGTQSLHGASGELNPAVAKCLDEGMTVLGAELFLQSDLQAAEGEGRQTRKVASPREFAGYTFGYNHSLFAQRTHDILSIVSFLRNHRSEHHSAPSLVACAAFGETGPIFAAARAVAGDAIDLAAIDTGGFRFGELLDFRDPSFLPGGAKYLDLPGLLALDAPHALWLAGEGEEPNVIDAIYEDAGAPDALMRFNGDESAAQSAVDWILEKTSQAHPPSRR